MRKFQGILFDMDGVLIDSEPVHIQKWIEVLKDFGISVDRSYFDSFIGVPDEEIASRIKEKFNLKIEQDNLLKAKRKRYWQYIESELSPSSTLIESIHSLERYKLGVVTASKKSEAEIITNRIGVYSMFQVIVSCDETLRNKPFPDIYLKASDYLGISTKDLIAIEDSVFGVQSAKAAGLFVVGVTNSLPGIRHENADYVCENTLDAISYIKSLN